LIPIYLFIISIVLKYKTTQPLNQQLEEICIKQIKVPVKINWLKLLQLIWILSLFIVIPIKLIHTTFYDINPTINYLLNAAIKSMWLVFLIDNILLYYQTIKDSKVVKSILSYKELFTNKRFLIGCLFVFLYNFNPSFGTPLSFIERDIFKWSGTFMGLLGAIVSAISIIGSILYFKFGKKINVSKVLYWSVFLGAITTLSYLYFTPTSAIVYSIVYSVLGMFIFLNVMSWMAEATIKGKEATSFALLCSVNNLAGTVSGLSGAYLFSKIGLTPLIVISALTSFLCLPLIKHLQIGETANG